MSLYNEIYDPVSTQAIGQTTTDGSRVPTISPSPVMEPSRTTQPSTSGPPLKSNVSTSQLADTAVAHSALSHAPSDDLNVRSSLSTTPILEAILPSGYSSFQAATRSDLAFSSPESHLSILAAGMSMKGGASYSTLGVREEITATAAIPPQLSPLSPLTDVAIDESSTHPLGTRYIEHRPPDAIVVGHSAVSHTPSNDEEVPSSPTPGLSIGMLLPLN